MRSGGAIGSSVGSHMLCCALAAVCCVGAGCQSPEAVGPTPLPLQVSRQLRLTPGPQILSLSGFAITDDPEYPPCSPVGVPRGGTGINARVVLSREGRAWVARSMSPGTDLEMQFEQTGERQLTGYPISGLLRGSAVDEPGRLNDAFDVRASLSGTPPETSARLEGEVPSTGFHVRGRVTGVVRFSDSSGGASTCTAVRLFLRPENAAGMQAQHRPALLVWSMDWSVGGVGSGVTAEGGGAAPRR